MTFRPTASWETLRFRAELLEGVRRFFRARGYLEVETPILSRDIVIDAHLDPFVAEWQVGRRSQTLYLQTSPEFHMKRLLAAGGTALFQISRVMRHGEFGQRHNPEFTMIEWYRTGDTHHDQMDCVEGLVSEVLQRAKEWTGRASIAEGAFERLSYDEAFARYAGETVLAKSSEELESLARRHGLEPPPGHLPDDRDAWWNLLLAMVVEPHLGFGRPAFVFDYPASQAALAKVRPGDPPVAERFELYVEGVEICNGYHELTDADELRRRMAEQSAIRAREGHRPLPMENQLLAAMDSGLPACAGVALGFDRLMMIAAGASAVADVLAFPFDRA